MTQVFRFKETGWALDTSFSTPAGLGVSTIYPLDDPDLYLGVSTFRVRPNQGDQVFFILRKGEKGELEEADRFGAGFPKHVGTYPSLIQTFSTFARMGNFLVLADPTTGHFWVFDATKGRLKIRMSLFPALDENQLKRSDLMSAILGVQPCPDGKLLIAARTEHMVLGGRKEIEAELELLPGAWEASILPGEVDDRGVKSTQVLDERNPWFRIQNALVRYFPEIEWWELDPEAGTLHRLNPPPLGAKERLQSYTELLPFIFLPQKDGQVDCVRSAWKPRPKAAKPSRELKTH